MSLLGTPTQQSSKRSSGSPIQATVPSRDRIKTEGSDYDHGSISPLQNAAPYHAPALRTNWPGAKREHDNGQSIPLIAGLNLNAKSHGDSAPDQHQQAFKRIRSAGPSSHDAASPQPSRTQSPTTPVSSPKLRSVPPHAAAHRQPPYGARQTQLAPAADIKHVVDEPPDLEHVALNDTKMFLQPETRPISQEQLINEIKGIYAGLVMVEKKCVEIDQQQSQTTNKLSNEQWQALIALHRTLLHEHHDFFLASQHPTAAPALRRLPQKYAMPARMWRHGIHSFLELLRHRLPHSLEHMLSFVYLAYQMMGLLMESVPAFHETWIECLGDLARYRMAIEEVDMRDRETWSNVARMWYSRAADRGPETGRIQHHLAVLARPNVVRQLFYYSKALVSINPFVNARESIMLLFSPFLDKPEVAVPKYLKVDASLVLAAGICFTLGPISEYLANITKVTDDLDKHITMCGPEFKVQGAEIASSMIALVLAFGFEQTYLWDACRNHAETIKERLQAGKGDPSDTTVNHTYTHPAEEIRMKTWATITTASTGYDQVPLPGGPRADAKFASYNEVTSYVLPDWYNIVSIVAGKVGDRNTLPFLHVTLAAIWAFSHVPGALLYIERYVPWSKLAIFLNTLSRSGTSEPNIESKDFPQQQSGTGRHLPEDFNMRGLVWAPLYYPTAFFEGPMADEDERLLELPSHAAPRSERCLWLGTRIASLGRYLDHDTKTKQFAATNLALSFTDAAIKNTLNHLPAAVLAA